MKSPRRFGYVHAEQRQNQKNIELSIVSDGELIGQFHLRYEIEITVTYDGELIVEILNSVSSF